MPSRSPLYLQGRSPAVALISPKFAHNVSSTAWAASCFGIRQVWFTNNHVNIAVDQPMPHKDVEIKRSDSFLDQFEDDTALVAVELRSNAETLPNFIHPTKAVYIFGPEDGTIPDEYLKRCHKFVVIPTAHCVNLSAAVHLVLYDRMVKRTKQGLDVVMPLPVLVEEQTQEKEESWQSLVK